MKPVELPGFGQFFAKQVAEALQAVGPFGYIAASMMRDGSPKNCEVELFRGRWVFSN